MLSKLFCRPAATVILIAVMLFAQQVVRSAESGATDFDDTPTALVEFQAFSTAGQYAEAMAVAARVVAQASDDQSATRAALVEPLLKLATVRQQSGDYVAATRAGELAIELIERNGGVFDPALVEPLVFLAQLEQASGHHPAALERLYRAQHILHRADGVMTQLQLPVLALMTKSYAAMKQRSNSNMIVEQAFAIKIRHLDENSAEFVPIVLEQAAIKAMKGQFRAARELIYVALEILEQSLTDNDPGLMEALTGLASVRYKEQKYGVSSSKYGVSSFNQDRLIAGKLPLPKPPIRLASLGRKEGTRTQQKVIHIMEEHPERFSAIERAEASIRLGDWYMIIRKPDLADDPYRVAWQILDREGNATELLTRYFGQPKRLTYNKPMTPQNGPGRYENYDGKYVEVRFSVNKKGAVRNLQLANSNSPAAMNKELRTAVKRAMFRPRYVDGQAVVTDNLFFREEFAGKLWRLADATE